MNRVLHVERRDGHSRRRLLRQALAEAVHRPSQKVQHRLAGGRPVDTEVSVLQIAGKQIVLRVKNVHAKTDMVPSPYQVHIIGKLVAGDVEVARRTGSAAYAETGIGHAEPKIVGYQRSDIDTESLRVKKVRIRPAE